MVHLANLSGIVGLLLPLLVAVIQQLHWKESYRAAVGFLSCMVAAFITTWVEGKLNTKDLLSSFFVVFTVAQVSYSHFWKKLGATQAIEKVTPPKGAPSVS
jgi:hypothetical protein